MAAKAPRSTAANLARGAVIVAIGLAALTVFALFVRPDEVRATVKSPRAIVIVLGLAVAWVLLSRLVLPLIVRNVWVRAALLAIPGVVIVWVLLVPYFRNKTVIEALPGSPTTLSSTPSTAAPTTAPPSTAVSGTGAVTTGATTTTTKPAPAPRGPAKLTSGPLQGIDHRASGEAAIYRLEDGSHIVRLENIDVQPGPDYFVYIVPGVDQRGPGSGINLGGLKGNKGSQNYSIPTGFDPQRDYTVVIWCRAFSVPIANATQAKT